MKKLVIMVGFLVFLFIGYAGAEPYKNPCIDNPFLPTCQSWNGGGVKSIASTNNGDVANDVTDHGTYSTVGGNDSGNDGGNDSGNDGGNDGGGNDGGGNDGGGNDGGGNDGGGNDGGGNDGGSRSGLSDGTNPGQGDGGPHPKGEGISVRGSGRGKSSVSPGHTGIDNPSQIHGKGRWK
jgi:hypothetical protein